MDSLITIVYYKDGEIIDGPNGVCYNCPPQKGVLVNNLIKYDELEYKLCHVMLIDHTQTMLSMIFQYPILMPIGNRNINYIQLPIKDDDDVRLMFHSIAQISPSNTIEMYLQTHPRNHSFGLSPSFDHEIMGHDVKVPTKGNLAMHTDDMNKNLAKNEEMGEGEFGSSDSVGYDSYKQLC